MASSMDVNRRLKASISDEPKQMLQPISGYEDEPIVSLEDACKSLGNIIDKELQQNILIAKMNSTEPENGLTQDESASIRLYTMEWKVHENSLHAILNQTLRSADRRKLQPWFRYLKLFFTAFLKLPPSDYQVVYRAVREDLSSSYPKGKKVTWWGISSCTCAISVLESPCYIGTSGTRTMFSIETNSGKSIQSHSCFQQEDEILLRPGIYLEVVGTLSPGKGLHFIQLREIAPPCKIPADPFDLSQLEKALPPPQEATYASSSKNKKNSYPSTDITPESSVQSLSNKNENLKCRVNFVRGSDLTQPSITPSLIVPSPPQPLANEDIRLCTINRADGTDIFGFELNFHRKEQFHSLTITPGQDNGPSNAELAGIKNDDRLIEINGQNIQRFDHDQVTQRIRAVKYPQPLQMLVVNVPTYEYYKQQQKLIHRGLPNVKILPANRPASSISS